MTIPPKKKTTTTRKKTTATRATPKVARKPETKPVAATPVLRKKELIERVVVRSGIKKKDAKPVIEAMLAVLGEGLAAGEDLNLQPLGKVMVKRVNEQANAKVLVCRIRQNKMGNDSTVVRIAPKT